MINAIVSHGAIKLLDPLPVEWQEGRQLKIDALFEDDMTPEELERHFEELELLCSTSDPEDEAIIERTIKEIKEQSKAHMARQMGLVVGYEFPRVPERNSSP